MSVAAAARPRDPNWEARVRASFARQRYMATLGVQLRHLAPGEVVLELPFREDLTQQHGFLHAGALTAVADSACGFAALSLMAEGVAVLSVEFKINLLAPASGETFVATGRVIRSGRTLTVCSGEVHAHRAGTLVAHVAQMQATMMSVARDGLVD